MNFKLKDTFKDDCFLRFHISSIAHQKGILLASGPHTHPDAVRLIDDVSVLLFYHVFFGAYV